MVDDSSSDGTQQEATDESPSGEQIDPPAPPNNPHTQNAETVPEHDVTTEIHDIEDQIRGAEKWMIGLTGALVLLTAGISRAAPFSVGDWHPNSKGERSSRAKDRDSPDWYQ